MFNFATINDPDFEAFVRIYNLTPFLSIQRTCEVAGFGKTKLYGLNAQGKLIVRDIAGKKGVFASELYDLLKSAEASKDIGRPGRRNQTRTA